MRTHSRITPARAVVRGAGCWSVLLLVLCGCTAEKKDEPSSKDGDNPPTVAAENKLAVALVQGRLTIGGDVVNLPGTAAEWEAALGPASRREMLAATDTEPFVNVYIWDAAGIVAVERPDLAQISKATFAFAPANSQAANAANVDLAPASAFAGTLNIDGVTIDASTTPPKLNEQLAEKFGDAKFVPLKNFPHSWNVSYGAWTITAITDVKGERLVELAIGD